MAPVQNVQSKKTGIGKGKVMEIRPWWRKKKSPNVIYVGLDAGRKTAYSKGKGHRITDWWKSRCSTMKIGC